MTKLLSNVIKGHSIRYSEEKRKLDFNEKAEESLNRFLKEHPRLTLAGARSDMSESGFVPGINAVRLDALSEDYNQSDEQLDMANEYKATNEALIKMKQEAELEVLDMLNSAKEEADSIINDAKALAQKEKKAVLKKAEEDGYKEGMKKSEKAINTMKEEIIVEKNMLNEEHELRLKNLEPQVVSLIITLIHKLTGVLLENRKEIIFYLVQQALYGAETSNNYIIRVSKDDYGYLQSKRTELLECVKEGTDLEIVEDILLSRSQCLIDADSRVIDLSLDVQLNNLTESLKMLAITT